MARNYATHTLAAHASDCTRSYTYATGDFLTKDLLMMDLLSLISSGLL